MARVSGEGKKGLFAGVRKWGFFLLVYRSDEKSKEDVHGGHHDNSSMGGGDGRMATHALEKGFQKTDQVIIS